MGFKTRKDRPEYLGKFLNGYSALVKAVLIDAQFATAWSPESDNERAFEQANTGKHKLSLGGGSGLCAIVGGCGIAHVWRKGGVLTFADHYDDGDEDIPIGIGTALFDIPTQRPTKLGTLRVTSGVVAFVDTSHPVTGLGSAVLRRLSGHGGAKRVGGALVVGIPNGEYELWIEEFGEEGVEGDWGLIEKRFRIVPVGTLVTSGAAVA